MTGLAMVRLIPGMLCDERLWSYQATALADDFAVTTWLPIKGNSIQSLAQEFLAASPPRFALCGLSLGGYIALEVMRLAPQRVSHLALIDTTPLPDSPERIAFRRELVARVSKGEFEAVFREALLPRLIYPSRASDYSIIDVLTSMAMRFGPETFVRQTTAVMGRRDYRDVLPSIRCPTIVACGRQDAICPIEDHRLLANSIPAASLAIIEECGHLAPIERPQDVLSVMNRWLRSGPEQTIG